MHERPLAVKPPARGARLESLSRALRSGGFLRLAIILSGSLLCLLVFMLTVTPKRYNLYVGMVPNQTIAANKDVEDELATLRSREAAADAVMPIYHYKDGVTEAVMADLEAVYAQMTAVRQYAQSLPDHGPDRAYSAEELAKAGELMELVPLEDFQLTTLMNASAEQFDEMYAAMNPATRNVMQGNVTQGQEALAINSIMQVVGFKTSVSLLQNVVLPVLRGMIQPNMVVDEDATQAAQQTAWDAVEPIFYKQGQNIVVMGEGRVTENQLNTLNSLGLLSDNSVDYAMYGGAIVLVAAILALMSVFLRYFCPAVFFDAKRLAILYLAAVLTLALAYLAKSVQLLYLAPLALPYMLLTVTLSALPAFATGLSTTLIASLMMSGAGGTSADVINLLIISSFSGALSVLLLHRRYQRSFILFTGTLVGFANFLIIFATGLMGSMSMTSPLHKALWALAGGVTNALLCLSLQPAVESLFNLPTPMRLLDLTNPNHPLMRRLLLEAPGTYHHSIIIANLAEASAEAIGANPLLARVGAYFHDIGKLKRPLYFKENQIGASNIHDTTDPKVSAAIIISHVREGLALARQHRLPAEIQQIIAEHHGNSLVSYFYNKALAEAGDKPVEEEAFRYDGTSPRSAEGALIMVCDTVEAAIRTLSNPTREEIATSIEGLIRQKMDSGLLDDSPLTLRDLQTIRDTCASVIYGVFHERIEYPPPPDRLPPGERLLAHLQQIRKPSRIPGAPQKPAQPAPGAEPVQPAPPAAPAQKNQP